THARAETARAARIRGGRHSAEKARLVMIILDSVDKPMEFDDFQETVGMLCEDIPGLECISDDFLSELIMDCWEIYLEFAQ
ncbi:MAG: hypothetical protein ACU85E_17705, partial [Gammaproteobacteria bacterium]